MTTLAKTRNPERVPTPEEQRAARKLHARLTSAQQVDAVRVSVLDGNETDTVPPAVVAALLEVLSQTGRGNAVRVLPVRPEVTTQQAADLLNVSGPYVVGLLDTGVIPSHKVGAHRRIALADVLAYRERQQQESETALQELADQAQELGMGY